MILVNGGLPRPTGWHGESGNDPYDRGHLTVCWLFLDGTYETHHVYQCDEAYYLED
jgi:hypothetical protein